MDDVRAVGPPDSDRDERHDMPPGGVVHPRLVGAALLALSVVGLWLLAALVRNQPAESGSYGQLELDVGNPYAFPIIAFVVLVAVATTAVVMIVVRRPASRIVVGVLVASLLALPVLGGMRSGGSAFSAGVGCIPRAFTYEELREQWADRPTVGEVLTGGLLQGNVVDDVFLSGVLAGDPDSAGCVDG